MGKIAILCGIFLCFSLTAAANDTDGTPDAGSTVSEPAAPSPAPVHFSPSDRDTWQLGAGFQYDHFSAYKLNFHELGYHADMTRYLSNYIGLEAALQTGFGHTGTLPTIPRSLDAKSLFIGGGPHISVAVRGRVEPWVHVLVGLEHFRFTQTNSVLGLGSNSSLGLMAGGGADFKIVPHIAVRVQGDYLGTHFQSTFQTNYDIGTGVVLSF